MDRQTLQDALREYFAPWVQALSLLALISQSGAFRPCTTVQMNTSFLRPLSDQDAIVQARIVRAGKTLAFGEIDIRGAEDGKSACRATTTCALL